MAMSDELKQKLKEHAKKKREQNPKLKDYDGVDIRVLADIVKESGLGVDISLPCSFSFLVRITEDQETALRESFPHMWVAYRGFLRGMAEHSSRPWRIRPIFQHETLIKLLEILRVSPKANLKECVSENIFPSRDEADHFTRGMLMCSCKKSYYAIAVTFCCKDCLDKNKDRLDQATNKLLGIADSINLENHIDLH